MTSIPEENYSQARVEKGAGELINDGGQKRRDDPEPVEKIGEGDIPFKSNKQISEEKVVAVQYDVMGTIKMSVDHLPLYQQTMPVHYMAEPPPLGVSSFHFGSPRRYIEFTQRGNFSFGDEQMTPIQRAQTTKDDIFISHLDSRIEKLQATMNDLKREIKHDRHKKQDAAENYKQKYMPWLSSPWASTGSTSTKVKYTPRSYDWMPSSNDEPLPLLPKPPQMIPQSLPLIEGLPVSKSPEDIFAQDEILDSRPQFSADIFKRKLYELEEMCQSELGRIESRAQLLAPKKKPSTTESDFWPRGILKQAQNIPTFKENQMSYYKPKDPELMKPRYDGDQKSLFDIYTRPIPTHSRRTYQSPYSNYPGSAQSSKLFSTERELGDEKIFNTMKQVSFKCEDNVEDISQNSEITWLDPAEKFKQLLKNHREEEKNFSRNNLRNNFPERSKFQSDLSKTTDKRRELESLEENLNDLDKEEVETDHPGSSSGLSLKTNSGDDHSDYVDTKMLNLSKRPLKKENMMNENKEGYLEEQTEGDIPNLNFEDDEEQEDKRTNISSSSCEWKPNWRPKGHISRRERTILETKKVKRSTTNESDNSSKYESNTEYSYGTEDYATSEDEISF